MIYDLPFLSAKAKRNVLGENARRLFNIDISLSSSANATFRPAPPQTVASEAEVEGEACP